MSLKENIENLFLSESGHLFEEPVNLLKQELREPATYNGIIAAIANGASKLNEIATKNGLESNKCAKYISALMHWELIKRINHLLKMKGGKVFIYWMTKCFSFDIGLFLTI